MVKVQVAGHELTEAERRTLDATIGYMRQYSGDSWVGPSTSPKGDGRDVPVTEIFSVRSNQGSASRRTLKRLADLGVLKACEMALDRGCLRYVPFAEVRDEVLGSLRCLKESL